MEDLKRDTRCLDCNYEFPAGVLVLVDDGWACPRCHSLRIERVLTKPFKYDEVKVKYEEGNHD